MDTKALLLLILTSVLQLQAVVGGATVSLFFRGGQDAVLPCVNADTSCSFVSWIYSINQHHYFPLVENGNVASSLARSSRQSVDANCSLVIQSVTAEDVGFYTCRQGTDVNLHEDILLNVLTISPSEADADPQREAEVTLQCTLWRYNDLFHCPQDSVRWVDQTGAKLLDEGVGDAFLRRTNCVSVVTVQRQSDRSRRYTCQFTDDSRVAIEAEYTPAFTDDAVDHTFIVVIVAVVGAVVVLVVMAAALIKHRKRGEVTEDVQKPSQRPDESEIHLTYVTVSHAHQQAPRHVKVKEDEVTYSTLNTLVKTEADGDPSGLYSCVSKPK
ncbi:hypothetical protein VZT92_011276 [Zoarces viviparus]|uniref:Ig-like domain-containing protein n=1 Tax=Zoarces viviparus TaxID=48416 RepID=A0AAW1FAR4_ZOAVI